MLSSYINCLANAGFALEEGREPPANDLLADQQPLYTLLTLRPVQRGSRLQRSARGSIVEREAPRSTPLLQL
jgi:hypothetical protein